MFDFQYDEPSANNVTETFMELANFPSNSLTIVAGSPVASKVPTLQSKPTSSAVAPSNSPGQTCLTTGATGSTASGRIVCRLVNKHKIWSFITTQPPFAKKQSNSVSTTTATALGKTYGQMLAQLDVPIIYFKGLNILNLRNIWAKELCSAGESGGGAPSQLVDPHLGGLYHYPKGNADPNFKAFNNACIEDLGWPAAW